MQKDGQICLLSATCMLLYWLAEENIKQAPRGVGKFLKEDIILQCCHTLHIIFR